MNRRDLPPQAPCPPPRPRQAPWQVNPNMVCKNSILLILARIHTSA